MTYHPDLLARAVPRYTSYPTAAEFHDGVGAAEQAAGLSHVGADEPVSLYVHIPYCHQICHYCGCNTGAANRSQRLATYLDKLAAEIELVARHLGGRGRVVRVAFGGGSPNAISAAQFTRLGHRLIDTLGGDRATWSVEIDPRSFDAAFADAMAGLGVTRASLGVQTFDPAIQQAIGRTQPLEVIERSVRLLRNAGVESLNFDLMYGLPGQDPALLDASIDRALELAPDRLAIFGYAHVPHLIPRQRRIDGSALPGAELRFSMAQRARDRLLAEGWIAIGFDHFARPGDPLAEAAAAHRIRRNFQGYGDDPCDVMIGLGASAVSRFAGALVQNEKNSGRYGTRIASGLLAATRGIRLDALERVRARAIERLLCDGETTLATLPDHAIIRERLLPFADRGLCHFIDDHVRIDTDAWPYARAMAALFDPWRQVAQREFSSAV